MYFTARFFDRLQTGLRSEKSLRLESLEERFFLSAGGIVPLVSPVWFADIGDSAAPRHVNPATLTANDTELLDKVISVDLNAVKQYDWIVRFDTASLEGISSVAGTAGLLDGKGMDIEVLRGLGLTGQVLVRSSGASAGAVSDWFASTDCIAGYELDLAYQIQATPNDTSYSSLWGMNNSNGADIDAEAAWDISTGSSSIVVGVIDTGVDYTHPDLAANIWTNPGEIAGNGIDDDGNGFIDDIHGYDFVNNDGDPMDDHNHGTHCAGTIAGVGNNGRGVTGVNWNSSIMALKFLDASGSGSLSDAVAAINYATMMRNSYGVNIRVTNNSWGGGGYSYSMDAAIAAHNDAGILFVAAAGNSSDNNDISPHYPSSYTQPGLIAVAATDRYDNLASFSCYGANSVDLAAPGVSIYSTVAGGGYSSYSGTSMATPHVAGVAALAWSVAPDATVLEIRDAILQGTDSLASLSGKVATGGRLNAFNTLELLNSSGPQAPGMTSLSVSPNPAEIGSTIALTALGLADSDGSVTSVSFYRDDNGNGQLDETDQLVGTDTTIIDSQASVAFDTAGLPAGDHLFFARATDNDALVSLAYGNTLTLTTPDEHGNNAATATLIAAGSVTDGEIQSPSDADWFKFQATAGWGYMIDTDLLGLEDSVLSLYDTDGTTLLAWNDDVSWPSDPSSAIIWQAPANGIYSIAVTNYATETGTYRLNLMGSADMPPSPTFLGEVDFREIADLDLSGGDVSYALQTAREGYLTVEALFDGGDEDLEFVLYDSDLNTLATSSTSTGEAGGERIDWQAGSGETYFISVSGTATGVDLRLTNLVNVIGDKVLVHGTDDDDQFSFTAAAMHQITVNQVSYEFDPAAINAIQFYGGSGSDTAVLAGSAGNDVASLSPTFATLSGSGYEVVLAGSESVTVIGGGGSDKAHFYDSAGDDTFVATSTYAQLYGDGFLNRAEGFGCAYAYAMAGGNDSALLYDSAGNDIFTSTSVYARIYGDGYFNYAEGFDDVRALAAGGGTDSAFFFDSAGDDTFIGTADYARLHGEGFNNRAEGFRYVYAYSTGGGSDTAHLHDSAGNDRFVGTSTHARMYGDGYYCHAGGFRYAYGFATAGGTDVAYLFDSAGDDQLVATDTYAKLYGDGFQNQAEGFRYAYAYATAGGDDTANLYDSAGNDWFVGRDAYARLYGANFYNYAGGFRYVYAYATNGGTDRAFFFDSTGDDQFAGTDAYARMYGDGYCNYAEGFRYAYANSMAGGTDKAYLYDSAGNDRFVGTSTYARLFGDGFQNYVTGFRYVYAYATAGGTDVAYFYDSAGDDQFVGTTAYAKMYGDGYHNYAEGFRYAYAYATAGGSDTANLYDSSGDDWLVGTSTYAKLYGNGFYNYAKGFRYSYAHATAGGNDKAYLYDSAGDDLFSAAGTSARIDYAAVCIALNDFDWVLAIAGSEGNNNRHVDAVDFVLQYQGTWNDI
jgi:subtilisin family serine protease